MKKLFALFMVVAMLSVAGTAMATTITADRTDVTVQRGSTATVSVTGTASHAGTLAYSLVGGQYYATLSGQTVTFSPASDTSAGDYEVIVRVVETYSEADEAGHIATKTDSAQVEITLHVTAPITENSDGGSSAANSTTVVVLEVVKTVVGNVKVVAVNLVAAVTGEQLTTPSKQQAVVEQAVSTLLSALRSVVASVPTTAKVQKADNVSLVSSTNFTGDTAKDIENAAARLKQKSGGDVKRAIGVAPSFSPKESGLQPLDLPKFNEAFYGKKPGIDLGARGKVKGSFFASDATGGNEAIFLDSTGAQTEVIPGNGFGNASADEGIVTAIVYVEAGEEYDPIITTDVTAAEEASFDKATGTTTVASVEVDEVEYSSVTVNTTATFNPIVDDAVITAVTSAYGKTVYELPSNAASTTATWAATDDEKSYMTANDLVYVCSLPVLENLSNDAVYIAGIAFDSTPTKANVGAPVFYPNGVSASGAAKSTIYTMVNGSAVPVTASNAKSVITNGRAAYLVFEVANGAVVSASDFEAAAVTLSKPAIVVSNTASSGGDDNPDEPTVYGVGSSSGGCSAGSAVLALAVLGSFVLTRKR